ncbi:MAG: putative porin [Flavobacteriaceae bacterium]|nr:putative porin [Flavobacteriaceae bacterium]
MRKIIINCFLILFTISSFAQKERLLKSKSLGKSFDQYQRDSTNNDFNKGEIEVELDGKTHFTDYKIISYNLDTTYIDTTLTMRKDYKFNYIRKDDFELLPFHNVGQTYTNLAYNFEGDSFFPKMGARAKYFNFKEVEDIDYYEVATPTSELAYRSGLEQGQVLDALLTINTSPEFNFSFAYKGLRSLGKYRNTLASFGNFRTTFNYRTKNNRYYARGHFVSHDFLNKENGGLTAESIIAFEADDPNFTDRGRLEVNYTNAENFLIAKRYHLEHDFKVFKEKDSIKGKPSNFKVGHHYTYKTKHYRFNQTTATAFIGDAFQNEINDNQGLRTMNNLVYLELESPIVLGKLRAKATYHQFDHYFNGIVNLTSGTVDAQLKGSTISVGADWNATVKKFNLKADISSIISGDLEGNSLMAAATYKKDSLFNLTAKISIVSKSPNFNFLHYQSDYIAYNWQNDNFKNEEIRNLSFEFIADKWNLGASASITQIDNYTYFDVDSKPQQANESLNYLKLKANKSFTVGKFTLDNTVMYQKVAKGEAFFKIPELITRNSLYYSNYLFKNKPLYLQTGFTFKYFTKYQMNAYNPLLSEFNLQNTAEYGGYPLVDFFVNAQVRRTRLYLKAENITSFFSGRNYYASPLNPYRDFTVRFGLVWNFFI